jgi:heterodisulfide reductase subunit B
VLGQKYEGEVQVTHFMRVLEKDVGEKRIASEIQADLSSLHLAPHYGCHITKPTTVYGRVEDPENPTSLDRLIQMTGAHTVSYENKLQCCGGGVLAIDEGVALSMAQSKLDHIQARQADAMVLACPFCNIMYESNQKKIEKVAQKEYKLPILYFPQLVGLALGIEPDDLGMKMNRIKTVELLKKINRRAA